MSYATVILADNPQAYWKTGEASGTLADSSGNGNTASAINTPTFGNTDLVWSPGASVGCVAATSSAFSAASSASLAQTGAFSLECWLQPSTSGAGVNQGLIFKGNGSFVLPRPYALFLSPGNKITMAVGQTVSATLAGTGVVSQTSPSHLVATWDGVSAAALILNNVVNKTGTLTATLNDAGDPLNLGSRGAGAAALTGLLAHCAIYNFVLSTTQIATHFFAGLNGQIAGTSYMSWGRT